eukprot:917984-Prymnesium_polylepis.2
MWVQKTGESRGDRGAEGEVKVGGVSWRASSKALASPLGPMRVCCKRRVCSSSSWAGWVVWKEYKCSAMMGEHRTVKVVYLGYSPPRGAGMSMSADIGVDHRSVVIAGGCEQADEAVGSDGDTDDLAAAEGDDAFTLEFPGGCWNVGVLEKRGLVGRGYSGVPSRWFREVARCVWL